MNIEEVTNNNQLSWREVLRKEAEAEYFIKIRALLAKDRAAGKIIYPADDEIFTALHQSNNFSKLN